MDDIDRRLQEAGVAWRGSLPPAGRVDPAWFDPGHRAGDGMRRLAIGGVFAVVALVVAGIAVRLGPTPTGVAGAGRASCAVTLPRPPFVPPTDVAPATAPPGTAWFGSAGLWTALATDGEAWTALPRSADGFAQKTFWWSQAWEPVAEPTPAIDVIGTRLDGEGTFTAGPGTNAASDDLGMAMLVGIAIPETGCWEVVGRYGDASLRYVVWVGPS